MRIIGENQRKTATQGQMPAHLWGGRSGRFATASECAKIIPAAAQTSSRTVAGYQHLNPSLCRSAPSQGGPVPIFRLFRRIRAVVIGYQSNLTIQCGIVGANSGATAKTKLGRKQCRKHLSSLPQWLCSALQAVLITTSNVALQALALALLPQRYWAQIPLARCLQAQLLVYCVMMQAFVAHHAKTYALLARQIYWSRRQGHTLAAVLRLGDEI